MAVSSEEFKDALACFASGVTIVTATDANGQLHGLTVSAFCSVSLEPPLILVCIDRETRCHPVIELAERFVVNILNEDQQEVSEQFAAPVPDKFSGVTHLPNGNGIPVIKDALAVLECRLKDSFDGGDHTIFVGEVERSTVANGKPLVYSEGEYRRLC